LTVFVTNIGGFGKHKAIVLCFYIDATHCANYYLLHPRLRQEKLMQATRVFSMDSFLKNPERTSLGILGSHNDPVVRSKEQVTLPRLWRNTER
jgi:hypothetical protein